MEGDTNTVLDVTKYMLAPLVYHKELVPDYNPPICNDRYYSSIAVINYVLSEVFLYGIIVRLLKQLGMEKLIAPIEKKKELRHNIICNKDYYGDGKIHRLQCFVCKKEC